MTLESDPAVYFWGDLARTVDHFPVAVLVHDPDGALRTWNRQAARLFGASADINQETFALALKRQRSLAGLIRKTMNGERISGAEIRVRGREDRVEVRVNTSRLVHTDGYPAGTLTLIEDVTEQKRSERAIRRLAFYDSLTRLPNRNLLQDRLRHALAKAERDEKRVGVLFIDLDCFKKVNDQWGHGIGDRLLQEFAARLRSGIRQCDTAARVGGDEFVLVLPDLKNREDLVRKADAIRSALSRPYCIDRQEIRCLASVGTALFPFDGQTPAELIEVADRCMYEEKGVGAFPCGD